MASTKTTESQATTIPDSIFWKLPSTLAVTAIRLGLCLIPYLGQEDLALVLPAEWWTSASWTSVLVKSRYTLSQVREAMAIQSLGSGRFVDAYQANHHRVQLPPLLLAALEPLAQSPYGNLYMALIAIVLDYILACCLESLARWVLFGNLAEDVDKETEEQGKLHESIRPANAHIFSTALATGAAKETSNSAMSNEKDQVAPLFPIESIPLLAAQVYYWSPFTILSGAAYGCLQQLPATCLVVALWEGLRPYGSPTLSTFFLASASYLELHYCVFLVPLLCFRRHTQGRRILLAISFFVWFASLQGLSYQLVGATRLPKVLQAIYGMGWERPTQSLSVQWYFAVQLFTRFRDYFEILLLTLPYMVVPILSIRLYPYPMVLVALFFMIWTIFRPVQTLLDANVSFCFLLLCPRSLARMGTPAFLALCSMGVPVIMCVVDHWMWLEPNTGNANFVFFQCLAYNAFLAIIFAQFCSASLQRDKALRLSEKELKETAVSSSSN